MYWYRNGYGFQDPNEEICNGCELSYNNECCGYGDHKSDGKDPVDPDHVALCFQVISFCREKSILFGLHISYSNHIYVVIKCRWFMNQDWNLIQVMRMWDWTVILTRVAFMAARG